MNETTNIKMAVSPCVGCDRPCNYIQCRDYRLWLNRCWNRYRHWQDSAQPRAKREDVWQYLSPAMVRHYLDKGPCARCPVRGFCPDDRSCAEYDQWVEWRWARIRHQMGAIGS